jgi:hypothetical protein
MPVPGVAGLFSTSLTAVYPCFYWSVQNVCTVCCLFLLLLVCSVCTTCYLSVEWPVRSVRTSAVCPWCCLRSAASLFSTYSLLAVGPCCCWWTQCVCLLYVRGAVVLSVRTRTVCCLPPPPPHPVI